MWPDPERQTWNILCTPFLIILTFHQTRSGPIVYIDRKQQRKRPVFIEKKKKLALTTFEGGGQLWGLSGLSVRGVVGVKLYWHHTYILNGAAVGRERERTGRNHTLLTSVMTSVKTVWWVETLSTSKANIRLGAALVCLWMGERLPNICCSALFLSTCVQPLLIDCCSSPTSHVWIELCLGRSSVKSLFWSPLSFPSVWKQGATFVQTRTSSAEQATL